MGAQSLWPDFFSFLEDFLLVLKNLLWYSGCSTTIVRRREPKNRKSSAEDKVHKRFFKYIIKEIVYIVVATTAIVQLGRNPEGRDKIYKICHGKTYEKIAKNVELLNDVYSYAAILATALVLLLALPIYFYWQSRDCKKHASNCFS